MPADTSNSLPPARRPKGTRQRAAIYVRQSLAKDGDELAVKRQERECRRLCELRGYDVAELITDNNKSASRGKRPGYERLLKSLGEGRFDVVVVYRLDRLLRRVIELEGLIELLERTGVAVATVQGDLDLSNAQGRLLGRILASVAKAEVETKSERHKLANRQKAEAGKPHHGGRRPFGYEDDMLTIREDEAALLREMAKRVIAGSGYKHVAHWLNAEGFRTTMGRLWYPLTVRNMLRKPRYAGIRVYEGVEYPAAWPAVFDELTWQQLQATMNRRKEAAGDVPKARKYLLTGLAVCGSCGLPLTGSTIRDRPGLPKRRVYACRGQRDTGLVRGCGSVRRNADALDDWVTRNVMFRLDTEALQRLLEGSGGQDDISELVQQRTALQARLDSLVDDYVLGTLTKAQVARGTEKAKAELRRIDNEIEALAAQATALPLTAGESLEAAWQHADDGWRRQLLSLVVEKVVVNRGITKPYYIVDGKRYRFDPSLIEIVWRV